MAQKQKSAPVKSSGRQSARISSGRQRARISLSSIPMKVYSLDMVFREFVDTGKVLPDEKERFVAYVSDLSQFVSKDVIRLMTSRFPPFENHEVREAETDAEKVDRALNSYLKNTAKSDASSFTWYERYGPKMKLAVKISFPKSGQEKPPQA